MTDDLRKFLLARLDEQEKCLGHMRTLVIAKPWVAWPKDSGGWSIDVRNGDGPWHVAQRMEQAAAEYIITVANPQQVLADLVAKRRIIARHSVVPGGEELAMPLYCAAHAYKHRDGTVSYPVQMDDCPELRDMVAPYAWHPDYREGWTP